MVAAPYPRDPMRARDAPGDPRPRTAGRSFARKDHPHLRHPRRPELVPRLDALVDMDLARAVVDDPEG
eukprot:7623703-Lingulodinium_polyedra.AAC.1